jgi:ubiquitin carboxyl-terminal hydrolase L5
LSFNLLALCQSPLAAHSQAIARGIASLRYLFGFASDQPTLSDLFNEEDMTLVSNTSRLSEFKIAEDDIGRIGVDDAIKERVAQLDGGREAADALRQELIVDVKATMGEYRAELIAIEDDEQRVEGRRKDYAPALHKWVTTLAEKGVLEEVINAA